MSEYVNADTNEIAKFSQLAKQWWDMEGPCKPLHIINPVRLLYVQQRVELGQKKVLDIGCGGGIFSESLAEQGASVMGLDMSEAALKVAKEHAQAKSLPIHYVQSTAEEFADLHPRQFDVVTCMELLEHVPDPANLIKACARLVKPGGHLFFSTINRTLKAYGLAILAAEYLLQMLPKGTHDYAKFIKPSELSRWLRDAGLKINDIKGIVYQGIIDKASLSENIEVNYILHAQLDLA